MPKGGERPGAGRKPGSRNKTADAARVMAEHAQKMPDEIPPDIAAMSPLEVMLRAMLLEAAKGKWPSAAMLARDAAPYVHPRLSAETSKVQVSGPNGDALQIVTTDQLPSNGRDDRARAEP